VKELDLGYFADILVMVTCLCRNQVIN